MPAQPAGLLEIPTTHGALKRWSKLPYGHMMHMAVWPYGPVHVLGRLGFVAPVPGDRFAHPKAGRYDLSIMQTRTPTWEDVLRMPDDGNRCEFIGGRPYVTAAPVTGRWSGSTHSDIPVDAPAAVPEAGSDGWEALDGWAARDGSHPPFGRIRLNSLELLPREGLDDAEPDDRRLERGRGAPRMSASDLRGGRTRRPPGTATASRLFLHRAHTHRLITRSEGVA